jgi:hypothetical protein
MKESGYDRWTIPITQRGVDHFVLLSFFGVMIFPVKGIVPNEISGTTLLNDILWRKMHYRVGGTFPALIFARLYLCRRVRENYPYLDIRNTMSRSKTIPGIGCRETPLDRQKCGFCVQRMFWLSNSLVSLLLIYIPRAQVVST